MSELDVLRRLGDQVVPPPLDSLRETARRRDRRTAGLAAATASVAVAAVAAVLVALGPDADRGSPLPAEEPTPNGRPLTYADGATIHYGDRTLEAAGRVVELDLTDYGVSFRTADGSIWFSDGSTTDQVGALGETGPGYGEDAWPLLTRPTWLLSANEGSTLAWFEFPTPGQPEVVTFDTRSGQEIARDPVMIGSRRTALPGLMSGRYVYWYLDPEPGLEPADVAQVRYDPATGEQSTVTERDVLADLNNEASVRSVRLKGDSACDSCGFHYSDGMNQQMSVGGVDGVAPVGAGDMVAEDVMGRPFRFDAPPGYRGSGAPAWLVQWVDDVTVVVVAPRERGTDLIECHLDTNTCEVAASGPSGLVVPEFGESVFLG